MEIRLKRWFLYLRSCRSRTLCCFWRRRGYSL